MQIILQSMEGKVLDSTIKVLLTMLDGIKYVKLMRRHPKTETMRCKVICTSVKVSVITKLELPEMVHISIKY